MTNAATSMRHIAGYKFLPLQALPTLRTQLLEQCQTQALKGTILLSEEGINLSLSGEEGNIQQFKACLTQDSHFADMTFRENIITAHSFKRLKVKIKKEIITLRIPDILPIEKRAAAISPAVLKQWLDEKRDVTLLDARNEYEINHGTFTDAVSLQLQHFQDFPAAVATNGDAILARDKPIVTFCTGGIRCEKAALYLMAQGYKEVYQLDGGILNYFSQMDGAHYQGDCFVFDERVIVNS